MRMLAVLLFLVPTMGIAAQETQLMRLIENGLKEYRIETDVTQLTISQQAALHLELSNPENDFFGTDFRTRQTILSILRWNDATNPDLK